MHGQYRFRGVVLALVVIAIGGPARAQQPPEVPPRAMRDLDHASYVELARQWQAYIDEHGETADALVNLGMAYDYTEEKEAALKAARRAAALAPDGAKSLMFLGKMLMIWTDNPDSAITVLERCRHLHPDYGYGLTMLATAYLRGGYLDKADEAFKTIHQRGVISRPLQDYGYNMLAGLPQGAVLLTNGDNDTYPPLALQSGLDLRRDVVVLNISLLNLPAYGEAQFKRHPKIRTDVDIAHHEVRMVDGKPTLLSWAIIRALVAQAKAPVYIAASVPEEQYGDKLPDVIEGINWRATGKGLAPEAAARLFLDTYRLDSATDWTIPWSLAPNEAKLISNDVSAMIKTAKQKGVDRETRSQVLDRAAAIAKFHHLTQWITQIDEMRKQ